MNDDLIRRGDLWTDIMMLPRCGAICEVCSYSKEGEVCQSAMLADHLIANGVTVGDTKSATNTMEENND